MTESHDIYAAPDSAVVASTATGGSVETALAGDYDFRVGDVIREAWTLVNGSKGPIIGALIISGLISQVVTVLTVAVLPATDPNTAGLLASILPAFLAIPFTAPIMAGVYLFCIRRATGQATAFADIFQPYSRIVPITLQQVLMMALIYLGLLLFVLPGLYLAVAYMLALPLLVEKNLGVWESLETSRRALSKRWWKCFGLMLLAGLLVMLGLMALLVGAIWTLPLFMLCYGVLYRIVFGVTVD